MVLQAPAAADAASWEGALLTSTSRLALPLDGVVSAGGEKIPFAPDSLAHKVAEWVEESKAQELPASPQPCGVPPPRPTPAASASRPHRGKGQAQGRSADPALSWPGSRAADAC